MYVCMYYVCMYVCMYVIVVTWDSSVYGYFTQSAIPYTLEAHVTGNL